MFLTVKARRIDPRDERWEIYSPDYRVYFWRPEGISDEWELTGADDVEAVMRWAQDHCDGRTFVIYVNVARNEGLGLVRLFGVDPTRAPDG
jgi:hypothetical protein